MLQKVGMAGKIGGALYAARKRRDLPASAVADALGVRVQAVYNWEKGKNEPASKNVVAAAEFLKVDAKELINGNVVLLPAPAASPDLLSLIPPIRSMSRGIMAPLPPSDVEFAPDAPAFGSLIGRRDVPERGVAVGGDDGDFEMNGDEDLGFLPRPPGLVGRHVFAIRVKNDSMDPKYVEGDVVYVEEKREPRPGEYAVIEMKQTDDGRPGRAFIKLLVSKSLGVVIVEQFRPPKTFSYPRDSVRALYRVVPNNEAMGV